MKKKVWAIFFLVTLLIVSGYLLSSRNQEAENSEIKKCVEERNQKYKEISYKKGEIMVGFFEGTTKKEAEEVVSDYDLSFELSPVFHATPWVKVSVPEGEEIIWLCKIAQHEKIKSVEPNFIASTPEK